MKQAETITTCAGIDVGKQRLDAALAGGETRSFANDAAGRKGLIAWLKTREVGRVGMEASGGYERAAGSALAAAGFDVVLHQPLEIRLFARLSRQRAKNDRLDAALIALATQSVTRAAKTQDQDLRDMAERLTAYEQTSALVAEMKTMLEHVTLKDLTAEFRRKIDAMTRLKAKIAAHLLAAIKARPDLSDRYDLLRSLPGVGPIVAIALIVRMPELGAMNRGQPAALLGVAPFDRDSGQFKGQRRIAGGRARPRRLVYIAALVAKRRDPTFAAFAQSLAARGKPTKVILVALMRKLIEAANIVLARAKPWRAITAG